MRRNVAREWKVISRISNLLSWALAAGTSIESGGKAKVAMRLEGRWKTYPGGAQPAVKDLSLDVHDGEVVTLLGALVDSTQGGLAFLNRAPHPNAAKLAIN